jgi:glutathione S-transferase
MSSVKVPDNYGYVVIGTVVIPAITSMFVMGGAVMKSRKECDVQYPNLYATPGHHDKADEFNRVQRGHQNFLEGLTSYTALSLIGGLAHPLSVAIGGVLYSVGSVLYQKGYADTTQDVATARYKKGGAVKWIGFFTSLYCSCKLAGKVNRWW